MSTPAYTKINFQNYPNKTTRISAERLDHIDDGVKNNNTGVRALEAAVGNTNNLNTTSKEVVGAINEQQTTIAQINSDLSDINDLITDARKLFDNNLGRATNITSNLPYTVVSDIEAFNFTVVGGGAAMYSGGAVVVDGLTEISCVIVEANSSHVSVDRCVTLKKGQIITGSTSGNGTIAVYKLAYKE